MRAYINEWFSVIGGAEAALGIPLVLVGFTLMFMGWQVYRAAIPFLFLLIGAGIGVISADEFWPRVLIGGGSGLALATFCFFVMRYAVAMLGGLAGSFVLTGYISLFENLNLPDVASWGIAGFGFVAGCSLAFILYREMVIILTSFVGSLLLVSGMNPILNDVTPTLHGTITAFLADYPGFFVPFLIGGPTLIATLLQMAHASHSNVSEAGK